MEPPDHNTPSHGRAADVETRAKGQLNFSYLLGTWSGRIVIINTLVFLYTSYLSGSLLAPDTEVLIHLGAKDPIGLARGELWRFVTPMFLHIGIIHYFFNTMMLYLIGNQLEEIFGGLNYLCLYLLAGVSGTCMSAVFSVQLSAGASGAIFGLLGAGFLIERLIGTKMKAMTGQRPKNRVYTMTVVINLILGMTIPFIDNAAHVGGLIAGIVFTFGYLNITNNRLLTPKRFRGILSFGVLAVAMVATGAIGSSPEFVANRLVREADQTDSKPDKLYYYSQAIELFPSRLDLKMKRLRTLVFRTDEDEERYGRFWQIALYDLRDVLQEESFWPQVEKLAGDLEAAGHVSEAWQVRNFMTRSP